MVEELLAERKQEGEEKMKERRGGGARGLAEEVLADRSSVFFSSSFPGDADEAEREREAAEVVERAECGGGGRERERVFFRRERRRF